MANFTIPTIEEMDESGDEFVTLLSRFRNSQDPVEKLAIIRSLKGSVDSFVEYWGETFDA